MRLETQDQLTAVARFLDDLWRLTSPTLGRVGVERIKLALGLYADAPSDATWEGMADTLRELVGERETALMLSDLEPYVR